MNNHERIAFEHQLERLENDLFVDTQRLSILDRAKKDVERVMASISPLFPVNHSARKNLDLAHGLMVVELAFLEPKVRRTSEQAARIRSTLAADDAHGRAVP